MDQLFSIWTGQTGAVTIGGELTLLAIIVWTFVWKGLALWRASHEESRWWFIILLVVNTLGILEILYLFFFSKRARAAFAERKNSRKKDEKDENGPTQGGELHG